MFLFAVLIVFFFEFVSYFDIRILYFLPEGHHVQLTNFKKTFRFLG